MQCICSNFGRGITEKICGRIQCIYIWLWPTLNMRSNTVCIYIYMAMADLKYERMSHLWRLDLVSIYQQGSKRIQGGGGCFAFDFTTCQQFLEGSAWHENFGRCFSFKNVERRCLCLRFVFIVFFQQVQLRSCMTV